MRIRLEPPFIGDWLAFIGLIVSMVMVIFAAGAYGEWHYTKTHSQHYQLTNNQGE